MKKTHSKGESAKEEHKSKKEEKEEKESIRSIVIVCVAFLLIFGMILLAKPLMDLKNKASTEGKEVLREYHGFIFTNSTGLWKTTVQQKGTKTVYEINLHYAPWELIEYAVDGNPLKFFGLLELNKLNALFVTFNLPSSQNSYLALAAAELSMNLAIGLNITPIAACTKNITDECSTRPIVDCTKKNSVVIKFEESSEEGISINKNCLIIKGNEMSFLKGVDKLLYTMYMIPVYKANSTTPADNALSIPLTAK